MKKEQILAVVDQAIIDAADESKAGAAMLNLIVDRVLGAELRQLPRGLVLFPDAKRSLTATVNRAYLEVSSKSPCIARTSEFIAGRISGMLGDLSGNFAAHLANINNTMSINFSYGKTTAIFKSTR